MPDVFERVARRVDRVDWEHAQRELDEQGYAITPPLLTARDRTRLANAFDDDRLFRKTVEMGRLRFGEGRYRYFSEPLPPLIRALRDALYPRLAAIANVWNERLGLADRYPGTLDAWLGRCHTRGQTAPTPLLLRYEEGGYNRLHQDLYGPLAFPLQATACLSPSKDFDGGEFLLLETSPRMQSKGEAIAPAAGRFILFPNALRPVPSARGWRRITVRHGVSRIRRGRRTALGVIFHDAS